MFNTLYHPNSVGGAELSVQALAERLVQNGNEVFVITTALHESEENINGVHVINIKSKNIYWEFDQKERGKFEKLIWHSIDSYNFRLKNRINELLLSLAPNIVHTNNLSGFSVVVWDVANQLDIKIVHTLRDYYLACPSTTMFKNGHNCKNQCLSCKVLSIPKKLSSTKVDGLVGISEFIKNRFIGLGYFENAKYQYVIGNDVGEVSNSTLEWNSKKIIFGFIGQISDAKGVDLLVSVFKNLEKVSNWELLIAGTGKRIDDLRENNLSNRIKFLGRVDSNKFYSQINVLVVPSLWQEPFGRVIVEGQKAGILVIGSKRGGIMELLPDENLFEPIFVELTQKITEILSQMVRPKIDLVPVTSSDSYKDYEKLYAKVVCEK